MLSNLLGVLLIFPLFFPIASAPQSGWLHPFPGIERPQTVPYPASPRLLHSAEPVYPMAANGQNMAGTVYFELIINEKGEVWQARVLSSPSPLVDAALDAVRQWRYETTIIDGLPSPVITRARVSLGRPKELGKCGAEAPRIEPIRVGGNVQESKLLRKVEPIYPQGFKGRGMILLQITVNEQGDIYEVWMLRGPLILERAVLAAVCQWKYSPTYLNGVPVPVIATVVIEFDLPRPR